MKDKEIMVDDDDSFQTIFAKFGAFALDKQESLGELIGGTVGDLDIEKGSISLGDDLIFDIQIIGTLSSGTNKWHWAWDNEEIGLPEDLIKEAVKVKEFGEKHNIAQFTTNIFDGDNLEAHLLAMTVSGIMDDAGYYAVDFDGVEFFVTIQSDNIPRDDTIERFVNVYDKFHKEFDVNARLAFEGYTKLRGYEYKEKEEFSVAKIGQSRVIVGFSDRGNVTHMQTLLE